LQFCFDRDHYRDSIGEYPNDFKDENGYDMEHHDMGHHQHGEWICDLCVCCVVHAVRDRNCFDLISSLRRPTEQEQIVIPKRLTSEVLAAIQSVRFIAQHIKDSDKDNEVSWIDVLC